MGSSSDSGSMPSLASLLDNVHRLDLTDPKHLCLLIVLAWALTLLAQPLSHYACRLLIPKVGP